MSFFSERTNVFYNQIAFIYPISRLYFNKYKKFIENFLSASPERLTILDVGCLFTPAFLRESEHQIDGVDFSEKMSRHNRNLYRAFHLDDVSHILEYESEKKYDYIILGFIISVLENREDILSRLAQVLKDDGTIIILNHFVNKKKQNFFMKWMSVVSKKLHFSYNFATDDCDIPDVMYLHSVKNLNFRNDVKCLTVRKKHEH